MLELALYLIAFALGVVVGRYSVVLSVKREMRALIQEPIRRAQELGIG